MRQQQIRRNALRRSSEPESEATALDLDPRRCTAALATVAAVLARIDAVLPVA